MTPTSADEPGGTAGNQGAMSLVPGRRPTIEDVARAAGVSPSAASKVVRGASGVSEQMRVRVLAAVESLGYRPNAAARAVRGQSYNVGIVLADLGSPFQAEIAGAIGAELRDPGYQEIILSGGTTPDSQRRGINALLDLQVAGLVLVAPWVEVSWVESVARRVPVVSIALHAPSQHFDTVVDDELLGAKLMVDHLVSLGHTRIVHTGMPPGQLGAGAFALSHTAREDGFRRAMRQHGLAPDVVHTFYSEEGGYRAGMEVLARKVRPTAVFAGADIAAFGVLRAAQERGLHVPEDLTVAGYDNIFASRIDRVALTTVDQSGAITGAASARLLLERIEGRTTPSRYVIAPTLVVRQTSGPPPENIETATLAAG